MVSSSRSKSTVRSGPTGVPGTSRRLRKRFRPGYLAELGAAYKHVKATLQQPSVPIEGDALDFDPAKVREMREFGYLDSGRGQ